MNGSSSAPTATSLACCGRATPAWVPFIDYPVEGDEAIRSGRILADYLHRNFAGVNTLSFASHSLGVRVTLETIRNLDPSFAVRALTVMAPAIDDTTLVKEYQDAAQKVGKISVLASSRDEVLKWAFPGGNLLSGIVTRGEPYWHGALGRNGPYPPNQPANLWQTPNVPESWVFGHHSYINCDGAVTGPPRESGPFALPQVVPPQGTPPPANVTNPGSRPGLPVLCPPASCRGGQPVPPDRPLNSRR